MVDTVDIEGLLALPALHGLHAPVAALLRAAAAGGPAPCIDTRAVLEDTLEALALLGTDQLAAGDQKQHGGRLQLLVTLGQLGAARIAVNPILFICFPS